MKTKRLFRMETAQRHYPAASWPQGLHCPRCGYAKMGAPRLTSQLARALVSGRLKDPARQLSRAYRAAPRPSQIRGWLRGETPVRAAYRSRPDSYDEFAFRAPRTPAKSRW
jgi:hypothetical protein